MNTLLLCPELFAAEGGIARALRLYLKALCEFAAERQGHVRLVALNDSAIDSGDLRRYGNDRLDTWFVANRSKRRFTREAVRIARSCNRVVCGHVSQLPVALAARLANRRLRYSMVAHGLEVWRKFTLPQRMALRRAERIFCVSEFTRSELLRRCPLPEGRAVIVPNALDPFLAPAPEAVAPIPSDPLILTVSRLSKADSYKGVDHLIAALPAVRSVMPQARLRVVGRGDDLPRLIELARKFGVRDAVEFPGYVPDSEIALEYARCRLFALPSAREGFGLVFIEAMAHGRPCLGTSSGGIPEVVSDGTGLLVNYGDLQALATACVAGLRRGWSEELLIARAREFSYRAFKERLLSVLP